MELLQFSGDAGRMNVVEYTEEMLQTKLFLGKYLFDGNHRQLFTVYLSSPCVPMFVCGIPATTG